MSLTWHWRTVAPTHSGHINRILLQHLQQTISDFLCANISLNKHETTDVLEIVGIAILLSTFTMTINQYSHVNALLTCGISICIMEMQFKQLHDVLKCTYTYNTSAIYDCIMMVVDSAS